MAAVFIVAAVVAVWIGFAGGQFSLSALIACEAAFFAFYVAGSLVGGLKVVATGLDFDLPFRLLAGYAVINTALFAAAWISPLGIVADFAVIFAVVVGVFLVSRPTRELGDSSVGLVVIGLALVATTLWCQDSLRPTIPEGDTVLFKPWIDSFHHAIHVRIFGASHGAGTIEDFRMAGLPARPYHYGCYLIPAFIKQVSGIHSYTAFAGILAPVGVFFTGLGAYVLVASFWGAWPGLAACAALLLLPDGSQQGMRVTFMSYHWLTQISPSATYGLALVALAWLFVLAGCRQGNRWQLVAGWLVGALLVFYKAHFFIANAVLLFVVPAIFYRNPIGLSRRVVWIASAILVSVGALWAVQKVPDVPPIRLDGSCVDKILTLVKAFIPPKSAVHRLLFDRIGDGHSVAGNLFYGIPFVLSSTLGLFAPLVVVFAVLLRKRTPALLVLFPLLVLLNFLGMFFGLALDFSSSTPDELSHRPLMIVYFIVVSWIGGAAGLLLFDRAARFGRQVLLGAILLLLAVPAVFGSGVHRMWAMRMFSPFRVPIGLVRAAAYMHDHGTPQDIFQDSSFDRMYAVAALSERRIYASRTFTTMSYNQKLQQGRIAAVEKLMDMNDAAKIAVTVRKLGLRWFLLNPGDRVNWPTEIVSKPVFALDGYQLYQF